MGHGLLSVIKKKSWKSIVLFKILRNILGGAVFVPLPVFSMDYESLFNGDWYCHYKTRFPGFEITHTPLAIVIYDNGTSSEFNDGAKIKGIQNETFLRPIRLKVKVNKLDFEEELDRYKLRVAPEPPRPKIQTPPESFAISEKSKKD